MLLNHKPQSPAAFAEQYILESIWNKHFPPGSILPAERDLSELIGVTRTTLREVLQRLARDGWLTIQHGKPTRVNDYWQTSGLGILDTLARLDHSNELDLVWQLLETRTAICGLYLRTALNRNPEKVQKLLREAEFLEDNAQAYIDFDWQYLHGLSRATNNPIYTLLLNGFKTLYLRVGKYYYGKGETRALAKAYYAEQLSLINEGADIELIISKLYQYGREGGQYYSDMRDEMPALTELEEGI